MVAHPVRHQSEPCVSAPTDPYLAVAVRGVGFRLEQAVDAD